jgi:hypothetical protein
VNSIQVAKSVVTVQCFKQFMVQRRKALDVEVVYFRIALVDQLLRNVGAPHHVKRP